MKDIFTLNIRIFWETFLLCHILSSVKHAASARNCDGGQDVFATVKENSPMGEFIANLTITGDPSIHRINLSVTGDDADWFVLEGKTIWLNSSDTRILDREVQGHVLIATVTCYEEGVMQNEHRITVEILNVNDNKPEFIQTTIRPVEISEFTAVNSTVFTVEARDADGDTLVYGIDETSPDAAYFRVDLPNSGRVILTKSLDYETKPHLQLLLYAVEMTTKEHYNTTTTLDINVADGDDQYPQFQPCTLFSIHQSWICANPLYTVNITEEDQDIVLDFSPGPIHAIDGDESLRTALTFSILSGADNGRFVIDSETGQVRLTRQVENRLLTPTLRLRIMAAQQDDPTKYSVATALVRVLAENRFPPQFGRSMYRGFVSESNSPASLVITYGGELLVLEATDRDFANGFNPKLQYSMNSKSNISQLFYITQEGLLIAKSKQLQANHNHSLEVLATDLESGDVVKAVIDIYVLQKGVPVPQGPLEEEHHHGSGTVGRAGGIAGVCLILLAIVLFVLIYFIKKRRDRQNPNQRACVAEGKHPNVVNQGRPLPLAEEASYHNEAFSGYDASTSNLHGKQGIYTQSEPVDCGEKSQASKVILLPETVTSPAVEDAFPGFKSNGKPGDKPITKSVSFQDFVVVRECGDEGGDSEAADYQVDERIDRSDIAGLEEINIDLVGISDRSKTEVSVPHLELVCIDKLITESNRTNTDLETPNMEVDRSKNEVENSEKLSVPENDNCQKDSVKEIGPKMSDMLEPLEVKMVFVQDDWDKCEANQARSDKSGSAEDANNTINTTTADSTAFSKAQSDKFNVISPDVSKQETEKPDVKCSNSQRPDAANSQRPDAANSICEATNKCLVPSGTEVDNFQAGPTGEEEGKASIKIVTITDPKTNADSVDEDIGEASLSEEQKLNLSLVMPNSPQCKKTKQKAQTEERDIASKDIGEAKPGIVKMQYDNENISTDLDNVSQDENIHLATFNPDLSKQVINHSGLSHVA